MTKYRKSVFHNERRSKHFHAKNQLKKLVINMTALDISPRESILQSEISTPRRPRKGEDNVRKFAKKE